MAKAKNYNNFVEVVGNVTSEPRVSEKTGDMRFSVAAHRKYTKKDGSEVEESTFLNVHVRPNRKYAKQESVTKGAFLRVLGHLENNTYKDKETGQYKGRIEIGADKIVVLKKREDGTIENTETGEIENVEDDVIEVENA